MNKKLRKIEPTFQVQMVDSDSPKATRKYDQLISQFTSLGKEIKISPKANTSVNLPGFKAEFYVETINVVIGIGKDHTADLIMTKDAWEALKAGAEVFTTTNKEFKEKFL